MKQLAIFYFVVLFLSAEVLGENRRESFSGIWKQDPGLSDSAPRYVRSKRRGYNENPLYKHGIVDVMASMRVPGGGLGIPGVPNIGDAVPVGKTWKFSRAQEKYKSPIKR